MKPKISVIIPTRNRPEYLEVALASLIGNKVDFEVMVVDHDSDEDKKYKNAHNLLLDELDSIKRLSYHNIKRHISGCYEPINYGISKAKGDYIKILGDDDALEPYSLELEYDAIIRAGADALMTSYWNCDENLHIKSGYAVGKTVSLDMMREGCYVPDATLFKKEMWGVPAKAEKLYTRWLWAVWYQMIAKGYKFVGIPTLFTQRYRNHPGQISKNEIGRETDNLAVKEIFKEIDAVFGDRCNGIVGSGNR